MSLAAVLLTAITVFHHMDSNKGYTLVEIIVVIGIIGVLSGIGIAKFNTYNQQLILKNQAKKIVEVIELAKKKAVSGNLYQSCSDFQGYRVVINASSFVLNFNCGGVYETIQDYLMTSNVTTIIGTGNLDFLPLGVGTNLTINLLRLRNSKIDQCIDISISSIGIVNINEILISC